MGIKDSWLYDETWYGIKLFLRQIMYKIYHFHPWHITPVNRREYALFLIRKLRKLDAKGVFVEVGCGLGDIVGNINNWHGKRYGFDISQEAIKSAKIIHPLVVFKQGSITDISLGDIKLLVMVNWPQGIDGESLREWICQLKMSNVVDIFVVDSFFKSSKSYPYCHDWGQILGDDYKLKYRSWGFEAAEDNRRFIEFWERNT